MKIIFGFQSFVNGLRFWWAHKNLVALSIVPIFLHICCITLSLYWSASNIKTVMDHLLKAPEIWYQYLYYYPVLVIIGAAMLLATFVVASLAGNLINIPFYDVLAEKTLKLNGQLVEESGLRPWAAKAARNFRAMLKRTVLIIVLSILLFIVGLFPFLGAVVGPISILILATDIMDYSFDHLDLSFSQRIQFVRTHFWQVTGFASGVGLTTLVPVINFFVMPGQVVAGTKMVAEVKKLERAST